MISSSFCSVSENMPLYDILNEFQKGHSHIAVVYRDLNDKKDASKKIKDKDQLEFKDSCRNKGKSAPLDKGRDLNISRINFMLMACF
jgi:metal transporter CNNM